MNKKLLEILVCPFDKVSELELYEFETRPTSNNNKPGLYNSLTNIPQENNLKDDLNRKEINSDHDKSRKEEVNTQSSKMSLSNLIVVEGLLLCKNCLRFYPIVEEIPIILPDELRDKKKDLDMLNKWQNFIPQNILETLKPWTISNK